MIRYRIKNWARFQHYKSRRPPWIKLHRTLLDDCIFLRLQTASRALAPLIWLLASESDDASVAGDHEELAFRLRIDRKEIDEGIKGLIASGYIERLQDASNALATRKQNLTTETETETETYTQETDKTIPSLSASGGKEGLLFDPGIQIPQDATKDAGKGLGTQMRAKPEKPRKAKKAIVYDPEIIAIYDAYPKKVGRGVALASIKGAIERGHAADAILEATKAYASSPMVKTTELQYIPNPSTFFNQDRFLDDRANWNQVRSNGNERQGGGMVACVDDGISDGYESMFGSVNF